MPYVRWREMDQGQEVTKLLPVSEAAFQKSVIDLAHRLGWKVAAWPKAETKQGWRTPTAADSKGFLDLFLVRERPLAMECKTDKGRLTPEQRDWIERLERAGIPTLVARPRDWDTIEATLR